MASKAVQLDFFINEDIVTKRLEEEQFKKIVTKSIRGLFARHNETEFVVLEMHKRIDQLTEMVNGLVKIPENAP